MADEHEEDGASENLPPPIQKICDLIMNIMDENSDQLKEAVSKAREAGYADLNLIFSLGFKNPPKETLSQPVELKEPTPLVDEQGNVTFTFTEQDHDIMKGVIDLEG